MIFSCWQSWCILLLSSVCILLQFFAFIVNKALFSGDFHLYVKKKVESWWFSSSRLGKVSLVPPIKEKNLQVGAKFCIEDRRCIWLVCTVQLVQNMIFVRNEDTSFKIVGMILDLLLSAVNLTLFLLLTLILMFYMLVHI